MADTTFTDGTVAGSGGTLEAIQEMYRLCGQPPAAALDTGGQGREGRAEEILDRERARITRERSWNCCVRRKVDITAVLNVTPYEISVPTDAFEIDTDDTDAWRPVTEVGGLVMNLYNGANTTDWGSALTLRFRYKLQLSISDTPKYLLDYIVQRAAERLNQEIFKTDDIKRDMFMQTRQMRLTAIRADKHVSDFNILDTDEARRIRGVRRGHHFDDIAGIVPSS